MIIPKNKEKANGWKIDFTFLVKLEKEIYSKYGESLGLEEIESVILILIEKGYLNDI